MGEIVMPRLSDTMEEGTILRWLKHDGEEIARGEELVEIETDKATMTYESDQAGVLATIASEGDTLAVGEVIARVGPATQNGDAGAPAGTRTQASAEDGPPAADAPAGDARAGATGQAPVTGAGVAEPKSPGEGEHWGEQGDERVRASPLARRIAREQGVDLHGVSGSGPGGRIVKADLERPPVATAAGAPAAAPSAASPPSPQEVLTAKGETSEVELTRTQQTIARRMAESKATIPDFSLLLDVDMEQCVELRAELKRLAERRPGSAREESGRPDAPTYNDMVVKAGALALREHPRANGSYRDGRLQLYSRINVGVAVAAHDALVVPTVFDADEKSLGEIARETRALAERVRAGTITPPELGGGTFTVSNLGMYGVRSFNAIINPPQAAILSVGALAPRAIVREGAVGVRNMLTLTLVCDHRILYGAEAAQFLSRIRELLETPTSLTL
jgi:pyruvate dehydrogenase E2 component (dihydrolipoamide acetyltransferase)